MKMDSDRNLPNHNLQCDYFHTLMNCKTCNGRILTMFHSRLPIPKCDCTKGITDATIIQNAQKRLILTRGGNEYCEYADESAHNYYPRSTQKTMKQAKTSRRLMGKKIRGGRHCLSRLNANNPLAKIMFDEPDPEPPSKPALAPRKWHLPEDEIPGIKFEYATAQKNNAKPQILERKLYQSEDGAVLDLVIGDPVNQGTEKCVKQNSQMENNLDDPDYNLLCTKLADLERQTEEVCEKYEQIKKRGKRKRTKQNKRLKNNSTKNLDSSDCNLLCTKLANLEYSTEVVCEKHKQAKEADKGKRAKQNRRIKNNSKNNLNSSDCNVSCKKLTDCQTEEANKEEAQKYRLKPQEEMYISVRNIADLQEPGFSQHAAEDSQVFAENNKENILFPNTQDDDVYIPFLSLEDDEINIPFPYPTELVQDDMVTIPSTYPSLPVQNYEENIPFSYPTVSAKDYKNIPFSKGFYVEHVGTKTNSKDNLNKICDPTVSPIHCDSSKIDEDLRRSQTLKPQPKLRVPYVPRNISEIIIEEYSCNHAACKKTVEKHFSMIAQKTAPCEGPSNREFEQ